MRLLFIACAAGVLTLGLAGCGGHPSAVAPQGGQDSAPAGGGAQATTAYGSGSSASRPAYANQSEAVPLVNGKPMWAANRRHSATDNAQYQFNRNGPDFGARSETDYVTKVHAFIDSPPTGAETIDRANGDKLIYEARSNTFAVVSRDGAPRTMFKPRDGATYWNEQKQRETDRSSGQGGGSGQGQGSPAT